jgi:hypothetical protein
MPASSTHAFQVSDFTCSYSRLPYFLIFFSIITPPPLLDPAFALAACDGTELELKCQSGQEVIINAALWGSRSASSGSPLPTCAQGGNLPAANALGNCQVDVTAEAQAQCKHGQSTCSLKLSAIEFGSPCQGVMKFLEANYACRTSM